MVKSWGQTDKYKARYVSLGIWGMFDTQNSAEGPKFIQSKPFQSHLQCIKILARIMQMRNGEEMGSNGQTKAKIWQFVYLERLTHKTVQEGKYAAKTCHLKAV
jgi:hypothetical protein